MDNIELRFYVRLSNDYALTSICMHLMQVCSGASFHTDLLNEHVCAVTVVIPYTPAMYAYQDWFYVMCLQIVGIDKFIPNPSLLENISLKVLH